MVKMNSSEGYRLVVYPIDTTSGKSFLAEYPDIEGCSGGGRTAEEAVSCAEENRCALFEMMKEAGEEIPVPTNPYTAEYSGRFVVRIPRSLHGKLVRLAEEEGVSLNQVVLMLLSKAEEPSRVRPETEVRKNVAAKGSTARASFLRRSVP
jgi:antitoxin HicB